jgi:hypothetical protein
LPQEQYSYIMHWKFKIQKQKTFYGYKIYLNSRKKSSVSDQTDEK